MINLNLLVRRNLRPLYLSTTMYMIGQKVRDARVLDIITDTSQEVSWDIVTQILGHEILGIETNQFSKGRRHKILS